MALRILPFSILTQWKKEIAGWLSGKLSDSLAGRQSQELFSFPFTREGRKQKAFQCVCASLRFGVVCLSVCMCVCCDNMDLRSGICSGRTTRLTLPLSQLVVRCTLYDVIDFWSRHLSFNTLNTHRQWTNERKEAKECRLCLHSKLFLVFSATRFFLLDRC